MTAYGRPAGNSSVPTEEEQVKRDARNRAVRSVFWGLLIDLGAAVVVVLMTAFNAIEWTRDYWAALGLLLAKTALQSVVAYFGRKIFPPLQQ